MRKPTMTVMPMATDDERQSVANALRRLATKYDGIASVILENRLGLESDDRFIYGSVFTRESVSRRADLIDPTCEARRDTVITPANSGLPESEDTVFRCGACGEILTWDEQFDSETDEPSYCESCGARVTDIGEPWDN